MTSISFSPIEIEKLYKKWNSCTSLPPPSIKEIAFMVETHLLYTIDSYSNSLPEQRHTHDIQIRDGRHWIKMEGEFKPIAELMEKIAFDQKKGKIISNDNPKVVWSYGANGLVKHDRFRYEALPVCLTLSKEQYTKLLDEGKQFWHKEPSFSESHTCILQLITTQHVVSKSPLWDNWARSYPQHVTFRLIDESGNLYSFGFERENDVITAVKTDGFIRGFFTSSRICVASPDYEETYRSNSKLCTSISISSDTLLKLKASTETKNREGITFNFLGGNIEEHANCMTYAQHLLKGAGVEELPERKNPYFFFPLLLPDLHQIPFVGKRLSAISNLISSFASGIFKLYYKYTPQPIQFVAKTLIDTALFIPRKISMFVINCMLAYAGGMKKGPEAKKALIENWKDFFADRLLDSHLDLIKWQEKQASTKKIETKSCVKFYV